MSNIELYINGNYNQRTMELISGFAGQSYEEVTDAYNQLNNNFSNLSEEQKDAYRKILNKTESTISYVLRKDYLDCLTRSTSHYEAMIDDVDLEYPEWAIYTYEDILMMENSGMTIPRKVLERAHSKAQADTSNYKPDENTVGDDGETGSGTQADVENNVKALIKKEGENEKDITAKANKLNSLLEDISNSVKIENTTDEKLIGQVEEFLDNFQELDELVEKGNKLEQNTSNQMGVLSKFTNHYSQDKVNTAINQGFMLSAPKIGDISVLGGVSSLINSSILANLNIDSSILFSENEIEQTVEDSQDEIQEEATKENEEVENEEKAKETNNTEVKEQEDQEKEQEAKYSVAMEFNYKNAIKAAATTTIATADMLLNADNNKELQTEIEKEQATEKKSLKKVEKESQKAQAKIDKNTKNIEKLTEQEDSIDLEENPESATKLKDLMSKIKELDKTNKKEIAKELKPIEKEKNKVDSNVENISNLDEDTEALSPLVENQAVVSNDTTDVGVGTLATGIKDFALGQIEIHSGIAMQASIYPAVVIAGGLLESQGNKTVKKGVKESITGAAAAVIGEIGSEMNPVGMEQIKSSKATSKEANVEYKSSNATLKEMTQAANGNSGETNTTEKEPTTGANNTEETNNTTEQNLNTEATDTEIATTRATATEENIDATTDETDLTTNVTNEATTNSATEDTVETTSEQDVATVPNEEVANEVVDTTEDTTTDGENANKDVSALDENNTDNQTEGTNKDEKNNNVEKQEENKEEENQFQVSMKFSEKNSLKATATTLLATAAMISSADDNKEKETQVLANMKTAETKLNKIEEATKKSEEVRSKNVARVEALVAKEEHVDTTSDGAIDKVGEIEREIQKTIVKDDKLKTQNDAPIAKEMGNLEKTKEGIKDLQQNTSDLGTLNNQQFEASEKTLEVGIGTGLLGGLNVFVGGQEQIFGNIEIQTGTGMLADPFTAAAGAALVSQGTALVQQGTKDYSKGIKEIITGGIAAVTGGTGMALNQVGDDQATSGNTSLKSALMNYIGTNKSLKNLSKLISPNLKQEENSAIKEEILAEKELKEQQKAMPLEDEAEEDSEINDQAEDDGDVKQDLKNTQKIHNVVPELFSSFKGAQKETKKDEISRIASASSNANINDNVTTDDKADRKLSRFNSDGAIESKKKVKKVQAVQAVSLNRGKS